ncbi:hypothetical protein TNCT_713451, partial [Trichonephila clavata]
MWLDKNDKPLHGKPSSLQPGKYPRRK